MRRIAPASICRLRLLFMVNGPHKNVPGGISTVPIPDAAAALMAFWMAVVFVVTPSPTAPKAAIFVAPGGIVGKAGAASAGMAKLSKRGTLPANLGNWLQARGGAGHPHI